MEKTKEQDCQMWLRNEVQQAHALCWAKSKMDRNKYAAVQPKPVSLLLFKQTLLQMLLKIY